jgi:hypothetical protein
MDMETGTGRDDVVKDTVEMMTGPGYMGVDMEAKECQEESVVVVVNREEDPHHHGGMITPVLGPATFPKNGGRGAMYLGCMPRTDIERIKRIMI